MTNKNFSERIKQTLSKASLNSEEKALQNAFREIVSNPDLLTLAKKTNPDHNLFYCTDYKISFEPKGTVGIEQHHCSWAFGIFKDLLPNMSYVKENYPDLFKKHGIHIKKELCFVGQKQEYNGTYCKSVKLPLIISKFAIEEGSTEIDRIIRILNKEKEIYSTRACYYEDEGEFSNNGLLYRDSHLISTPSPWEEHYLGTGLTSKKLETLILENWVKPLSYLK